MLLGNNSYIVGNPLHVCNKNTEQVEQLCVLSLAYSAPIGGPLSCSLNGTWEEGVCDCVRVCVVALWCSSIWQAEINPFIFVDSKNRYPVACISVVYVLVACVRREAVSRTLFISGFFYKETS